MSLKPKVTEIPIDTPNLVIQDHLFSHSLRKNSVILYYAIDKYNIYIKTYYGNIYRNRIL